ncbi:RING-H2 finger protein ATL16-like [Pyrus x bretschneideri]|uniref:RING-H2 finger protein ATL16-like n=1 Tax=Pyrus x bretschneideri TaxID=225117 RepID=UPI00202F360E|nr:RING-H2 finger protein ATL16-like [Pyrus x bretschneideri]
MGCKLHTIQSPFSQPPQPPPTPPPKTNLPMFYYGLIIVSVAAIILAMYNLIFVKLTSNRHDQSPLPRSSISLVDLSRTRRSRSFENLDSFRYKKNEGQRQKMKVVSNVLFACQFLRTEKKHVAQLSLRLPALSHSPAGELMESSTADYYAGGEFQRSPACKRSFHAPCIDMWLNSHSDCPLCRTPLPASSWSHPQLTTTPEENSREVLLL